MQEALQCCNTLHTSLLWIPSSHTSPPVTNPSPHSVTLRQVPLLQTSPGSHLSPEAQAQPSLPAVQSAPFVSTAQAPRATRRERE